MAKSTVSRRKRKPTKPEKPYEGFPLFALAYNLANFLRRLALPPGVKHWSLTTLREKLVKIGAKVGRHAKYVTFQLAEVAVPRQLFREILRQIGWLKTKQPYPAPG